MSDHAERRSKIVKLLSYRTFALNRSMALASNVRNGTATSDEEAIYFKSRRLMESCDDFIHVLVEHGIDHLGRDLSDFEDWPTASFWSCVGLRCRSYLAATFQDGVQGVLEELKELQDQLDSDLLNIKLSKFQ